MVGKSDEFEWNDDNGPAMRQDVDNTLAVLLGLSVPHPPAPTELSVDEEGTDLGTTELAQPQRIIPMPGTWVHRSRPRHLSRNQGSDEFLFESDEPEDFLDDDPIHGQGGQFGQDGQADLNSVLEMYLPVPSAPTGGDDVPIPLGPMAFDDELSMWEQQPGEPVKIYQAFCIYRDLGPRKRSMRRAYFIHYKKDPRKNAYATHLFSEWGQIYSWKQRAEAYDRDIEQRQRKYLEGQRLQARLETADLGMSLRMAAQEAIDGLRQSLYEDVRVTDPKTGETYMERRLRRILKPTEIAQLADVGVKLERLALELSGGVTDESNMGVTLNLGIRIDQGASTLREEARRILIEQEAVAQSTAQVLEVHPSKGKEK